MEWRSIKHLVFTISFPPSSFFPFFLPPTLLLSLPSFLHFFPLHPQPSSALSSSLSFPLPHTLPIFLLWKKRGLPWKSTPLSISSGCQTRCIFSYCARQGSPVRGKWFKGRQQRQRQLPALALWATISLSSLILYVLLWCPWSLWFLQSFLFLFNSIPQALLNIWLWASASICFWAMPLRWKLC